MNNNLTDGGAGFDTNGFPQAGKPASESGCYKWFLVAMLSFAFFFHQADR